MSFYLFGKITDIDRNPPQIDLCQLIEIIINQRLAAYFHQRLGTVIGQIFHPHPAPCCQQKSLIDLPTRRLTAQFRQENLVNQPPHFGQPGVKQRLFQHFPDMRNKLQITVFAVFDIQRGKTSQHPHMSEHCHKFIRGGKIFPADIFQPLKKQLRHLGGNLRRNFAPGVFHQTHDIISQRPP